MADFSQLDSFEMFTPSDMLGGAQPNLGGPIGRVDNGFKALLKILENNGRGVTNVVDMKTKLAALVQAKGLEGVDLSQYLSFYSTQGFIDSLGPGVAASKKYQSTDGSTKNISSIQEIIGAKFEFPKKATPFDLSIVLSRSPFFNPTTRNTKKAETFMNSMPSTVLSQLVPYLQVEFQVPRNLSSQLQAPGLLKFLMGATDKVLLQNGADKAMLDGHQTVGGQSNDGKSSEIDFAGMEMFTSPQTLTNPLPNASVGTDGARYTEIIDPFRPLATLEHLSISSVPAVGIFCYKKASMTIKVHDRSRLAEISDMIRPRVYSGVTIWLTYGWRAPVRPSENAYFDYVNNNMMMREAYGIVNSNFVFDAVGQVVITLELFTKGVSELRDLKISDNGKDMTFRMGQVKDLIEQISNYRQRLHLDPPQGLNKEIRTFQILDAAEAGTFPDLKANDAIKAIDGLRSSLKDAKGVDKDALSGLIGAMKKLYTPAIADPSRFAFKDEYESRVTATIKEMFTEVETGPDPFLPIVAKGKLVGDDLAKAVGDYNAAPTTTVKAFKNSLVSFGKLFSVFSLRSIISADIADEVQLFFYNINESCGPVSSHSVAEFPIDMPVFLDQYREHVLSKGGERITLEEFLQLVINAQFLDNRAVGYGLRTFYEPYNPKDKDPRVKNGQEGNFNSRLAAHSAQWGPFKKPVIEMYVEMSHEQVSEEGDSDILQQLSYSAKDASTVDFKDMQGKGSRKIMRIHVYDKQTNPYVAVGRLLRNANDTGFLQLTPTDYTKKATQLRLDPKTIDLLQANDINQLQENADNGQVDLIKITSNQQIKDVVSKLVPTIRYGANGSTITHANLASKADPLLSTVQMIKTMTVRNSASPNGAGAAGIPLRVIPAQLQMNSLGNPLATMAQTYFIDFQTGTTLDNLYIVTGLTHAFSPGKFETSWQLGYSDAYGVFEGAPTTVKAASLLKPGGT